VTFKGVFARNLAHLNEVAPQERYREFLIRNSDSIWNDSRNESNAFGLNWEGPFDYEGADRQGSALNAVIGAVRAAEMNLALGSAATGTAGCAATEGPGRAVDGNSTSKWCAVGGVQTLTLDLGREQKVTGFVLRHASSNGEDAAWNTGAYEISVSLDGETFAEVVTVTGNTAGITEHYLPTESTRYVRLNVSQAEATAGEGPARIFEFEVLGFERAAP
jgi:mannosyl-glycoprotein endo-beta-N-acetylglucosaminidase